MQLAKNIVIFLAVFGLFAFALSRFQGTTKQPEPISITQVAEAIQSDKLQKIQIDETRVDIVYKDGSQKISTTEPGESLTATLVHLGVESSKLRALSIEFKRPSKFSLWLGAILPFLLPLVIIIVFIVLTLRQVQSSNSRAMMFGQSSARQSNPDESKKTKTTFKDVAGSIEAKQELMEVVEFLRSPQKFLKLGARIPKGVLLVGHPGTGKTLLARAVSGEAGVPFFHISGSEFVEMFVGVGASRVRDLFKRAKKSGPCIVFIDEIDAVGRQRGAGLGGSHDEREQTLNQILVEMDGFDTETNVIVMAATNRPDVLDPALLRPGRFDRRVVIDLPDLKEREEILKIHALNKPVTEEVSFRRIAERTAGFSGADLFNLLNEAAIFAARKNKTTVDMDDLLPSIEKVMMGPERRSRVISEKEKKITAYHEAGHAVAGFLSEHTDEEVHKISIIPRGHAGGYTLKLPSEDKYFHGKKEFIDDLSVLIAGYATEKIVFNDITTGAASDLKRATELARDMITRYGMSEKLGPRTFGKHEELIFLGREVSEQRDYSDDTATVIDEEVDGLIKQALETASRLVQENRAKMDQIVVALLEKETIEKEEFEALMKTAVV